MLSYTLISYTFGIFTIYLLNTLMSWRAVALVCSIIPVLSAIAICFVSFHKKCIAFRFFVKRKLSYIFFRFQKVQCIYYQKIELKRLKIRFVGFADGLQKRQWLMNSMNFSAIVNVQNPVIHASNRIKNVLTRFPVLSKSCRNSNEIQRSNHF